MIIEIFRSVKQYYIFSRIQLIKQLFIIQVITKEEMADDSIASSASFYNPEKKYSSQTSRAYCQQIKMNMEEIGDAANDVLKDMINIKKNLTVVNKLLNVVRSGTS